MQKRNKFLAILLISLLLGLCKYVICFKYKSNALLKEQYYTPQRKNNICKISKKEKPFILYNYGKEYFERIKKLNFLSRNLNIDSYPSTFIKRTIKIDKLKKKYEHLKNGEHYIDKVYVVYGRVMAKRNNGMFLNIQDDVGTIQIYLDNNIMLNQTNISTQDKDLLNNPKHKQMEKSDCEENLQNYLDQSDNSKSNENAHNKELDEYKNTHEIYARKIIEVGDFVAVKGYIRKSLRGELTLHTKNIYILTKALLPLPDKHKGMKDIEYKYRKRYLDFLTNSEQKEKIITRFNIIQEIRRFLLKKKYLEVDTPMLQLVAGGASAKPFETHLKSLDLVLYLRIAPELFLKKLIISGISEKIFELSKCFRNEGLSTIHNPEFTMLEIYKSYANYKYMMKFTKKLIKNVAKKISISSPYSFILQNKWEKKSFIKIIKEYTSINFLKLSFDQAYEKAKDLNITFDQEKSALNWGLVVEEVFKKKIEPFLPSHPIHIYHLPSETSPLSKTLNKNKKLSERFETYIGKMEIANGYSEEANTIIQEKKFWLQRYLKNKNSNKQKSDFISNKDNHQNETNDENNPSKDIDIKKKYIFKHTKNENHEIDYDYITALAHGLPPTGGLGIGIDRLCMLLTNSSSIKNILPFPIIKPN
ncbi:lysine--tRNA ligase, putative [Plasmodium berghei]|uniref:lysine--tRNA ligase n=2 Tax=Plasmodium berghei TaxID=5821 RepID=A0A509AJZ0_PLABA|nr:lysine--tRNA ligase, putative [Plasmodium berghei ANKA]CXI54169.1 lysine--tRNA ligase, putative [Plasmodium berghei]SCL94922.1 lysine--tRNA ligase, putative [Plasmodium berghei]SCM16134.1 lysine--tRNA ligase, putative [Plasmodium berghei]SCM17930.1 lysine--tRNA ligase, putative [Plasmodium berghei]SCN26287.1 lysine--tRNA ligase, putative [Plasmodium berghei]|eukprot:XP_034422058.1 lysine--tRNA ligase, putative [Plasmodium berghei ANKA]